VRVRDAAIRPRVLLVTGAYYPEISAAAVQCRAVAQRLQHRAALSVLTTAVTPSLPAFDRIDGVAVHRVVVDVRSARSKAIASIKLASSMLRQRGTYDVVHLHGFSQKNLPVSALGRLLGKPVVLTLHTSGQDEPEVVKRRGALSYWAFTSPQLVMAVSPQLATLWRAAGLPADRVRTSPNGIDTSRFRPANDAERIALRKALGWPRDRQVVLFVGFFSRDKRPDLLFRAWRLLDRVTRPQLVFVGAKGTGYYEIDDALGAAIRRDALEGGVADHLTFLDPTNDVERCFRAADLFVLPSVREAHPLALLEAMACGLPVIATRLPGATDAIVEDGLTGKLFAPDDEQALAGALRELLADPAAGRAMGERAREAVSARYDIGRTADAWLDAYQAVLADQ
jgi:glycosyltransferase involved in cell wall biosynthesis